LQKNQTFTRDKNTNDRESYRQEREWRWKGKNGTSSLEEGKLSAKKGIPQLETPRDARLKSGRERGAEREGLTNQVTQKKTEPLSDQKG